MIQHRKWIIMQAVAVITAVAMVMSFTQKPVYEAQAVILIREKTLGTTLFDGLLPELSSQPERSLYTHISLIKMRPLAVAVIKKLDLNTTPEEFLKKVTVKPEEQRNIILIKVRDENPRLARDQVNTLAKEYVNWSGESTFKELRLARRELFNKIEDTKDNLTAIAKEIAGRAKVETISEELTVQLDIASRLYGMLAEKYEQLRITEAMKKGSAELVVQAVKPVDPVKPKPLFNGIMALFSGMVLGLGFAFLVEYFDNTLKTPLDVEQHYRLPLLGEIPTSRHLKGRKKSGIVSRASSRSLVAEAFRTLRTNIKYLNFDQSISSITVASAGPKEGKTSVLTNLAITLASDDKKVILIGADLRRPQFHPTIATNNSHGLSKVLAGETTFEEALQDSGIKNLHILPSGPCPPNPTELLGSVKMKEIIRKAKSIADIVLVDTPPALAVTDCAVLAPQTDGVIVVAKAGSATRESARSIKKTLGNVNARLLGVVLNGVSLREKTGYYYYGYYSEQESRTKPAALKKMLRFWRKGILPLLLVVFVFMVLLLYFLDVFLKWGIFMAIAKYLHL